MTINPGQQSAIPIWLGTRDRHGKIEPTVEDKHEERPNASSEDRGGSASIHNPAVLTQTIILFLKMISGSISSTLHKHSLLHTKPHPLNSLSAFLGTESNRRAEPLCHLMEENSKSQILRSLFSKPKCKYKAKNSKKREWWEMTISAQQSLTSQHTCHVYIQNYEVLTPGEGRFIEAQPSLELTLEWHQQSTPLKESLWGK